MKKTLTCALCSGSGERPCNICGGSKKVFVDGTDYPCEHCSATGKTTCRLCDGEGKITVGGQGGINPWRHKRRRSHWASSARRTPVTFCLILVRMLIVDVEASGTEHWKHSIVSVGALDIKNPTNRFYEECRVWDGAHIMEGALQVNGFTEAEIKDPKKQSEADLIHSFLHWSESVEERTIAGQNPSFDRDFLKSAAERAGHTDWPFAYRTIDVHTLAYMHMVGKGKQPPVIHRRSALDLDAILNYVGIPAEPTPHNALTGALSHAECISRLLYGRKLLPEFMEFEIPFK